MRAFSGTDAQAPFTRGYAAGVLSLRLADGADHSARHRLYLYGTVGQVSIGRLFAAGIVPGLMLWASLAIAISITARKRGYAPERDKAPTIKEIAPLASWGGIWAILFPIILLAGLRFGVFTPSEIGAFAVIYAVVIGFFAYRMMTAKTFIEAVEGSLVDVGAVMFLLALSGIFGYGIVFERIPEVISEWMLGVTDEPHLVMVMIVLFILLAGTFMEGSVLIIMLTPIFLPLVTKYGIDPVHFGLVFIIAATIGNYTPPVGGAMFVVCQVLRCPIGEYTRESLPFLFAVSLVTILLIFTPEIVLFVPDWIFGKDLR